MKPLKALFFMFITVTLVTGDLIAQVGYYDAPYTRYEADQGNLNGATILSPSFDQSLIQSEASEQTCVNLFNSGSSVSWPVTDAGDGLVVRYSVPDDGGGNINNVVGTLDVYSGLTYMGTLNLKAYWAWEYLSTNGNPNNGGVTNANPKMRFDEVRLKLSSQIPAGGTLRLVRTSGNVTIDFAELEPVPAEIAQPGGSTKYVGDGSDLQNYIDTHGGQTIYVPAGYYNVNRDLYFGNANTSLRGAGMWYTQINFTSGTGNKGGLWAQANNINYSDLFLTTNRNSRSSSYKAINGAYTNGTTIKNVWVEHFECGAWIAQYGTGPGNTDRLTMSYCRFRNNYADGTNLCKGTTNTIVEHCSYRNNGDDDMAIWSADNAECQNNTFRFNTSENCWRSAGVAIYGGLNNKAENILIQDNVEVGIKVNNAFPGKPFNDGGMHEFSNIIIKRCGTSNDLFGKKLGAIEMAAYNVAGTQVKNVKFSCINIIDSKRDAIYMHKVNTGDGFYNIQFQNITINGTGKDGSYGGTGVLVENGPGGSATYCGMTYTSAGTNVNTNGYSFTAAGGTCPTGCSLVIAASSTKITSTNTFGICSPATFTATSIPPSGKSVNSIEFYVDNSSVGIDNSSTYEATWTNPTAGTHQVKAISTYSDGTTTTALQTITVADALYPTGSPINWNEFTAHNLNVISIGAGNRTGAADLSANFKTARDATNLYIFVDVTDDNLSNDGGNAYDNDQIELGIDIGNDKLTTYGTSDYFYNFLYNSSAIGAAPGDPTTGITATPGTKTGGYTMTIKIPWSTIGGLPAAGSFIGLEVQVDDDDGGGARDSKIAWTDQNDLASQNPSVFGTVQMASCNNPLPVELLAFAAERNGETILLNWSTASEKNNKEFIIERSATATDWQAIASVAGAGNSSVLRNYQFIDYSPLSSVSYYRLRQVDIDDKMAYSPILVVQNTLESTNVSIAPNPFTETLTIRSTSGSDAVISIYDLSGKNLFQVSVGSIDGSIIIQPSLPSGSYIMTVQTNTGIDQFKIIKGE